VIFDTSATFHDNTHIGILSDFSNVCITADSEFAVEIVAK
jgi:hypothetical protein